MEMTSEAKPIKETLTHLTNGAYEVKLVKDASKRLFGHTFIVQLKRLDTGDIVQIMGTESRCWRHIEEISRGMWPVRAK